jgi:hypothetical protein
MPKGVVLPMFHWVGTRPWRGVGEWMLDPCFLDLGSSWRWAVNITLLPLYLPYPLNSRLGGPKSRYGRYGEVKMIDPTGTRTPIPGSSSPIVLLGTLLVMCPREYRWWCAVVGSASESGSMRLLSTKKYTLAFQKRLKLFWLAERLGPLVCKYGACFMVLQVQIMVPWPV